MQDIYGYVGEPVLRRAEICDLGESIMVDHFVNHKEEGINDLLQVSERNEHDISSDCPPSEHEHSDVDDFQSSASISFDVHDNTQTLVLQGLALALAL